MNQDRFNFLVDQVKRYEGVEEIFILSPEGQVIFTAGDHILTSEESRDILSSWKNGAPSLMYQGLRYVILKNDELQFVAKNLSRNKGNLLGSKTKERDYLLVHTRDESLILLEWSIHVNKVAWS
ncbi:MAG: hypothetical protein ACTSXH_11975 [Promethearchaeota archaeon]